MGYCKIHDAYNGNGYCTHCNTKELRAEISVRDYDERSEGGGVMEQQTSLMLYCPSTRADNPYPSHAAQYREYHGNVAWLYNPWTGNERDPRDIGSDVTGLLIIPPNEKVLADDARATELRAEIERLKRECQHYKNIAYDASENAERWRYARNRLSPAECVNHGWPSLGDLPPDENIAERLDRMADLGIGAAREE